MARSIATSTTAMRAAGFERSVSYTLRSTTVDRDTEHTVTGLVTRRCSKRLPQVHVLGLELVELRHWSVRQFVAVPQVEAHRVLRRYSADDDLGFAGVAGDEIQFVGKESTDARSAERCVDVEERELRDVGAQMRHDKSDPDEPPIREGAECDPARVDVMFEGLPLRLDGVLVGTVRVPGG